jgi:D-aminoacyl-tRNA deacylase
MKVIIVAKTDIASMNIFENLKALADLKSEGEFFENPLYLHEDYCIATINDEHIFHDDVDLHLAEILKEMPECIIYASRHRSESGNKSLTVHPIGNFAQAKFGGRERNLVPASPHMMTQSLRILKRKAKENELDFSVSFEATHHGPYLQTPTFFIEIGSDEDAWRDKTAGRIIAETILEVQAPDYPVGIGVGGGHYAPRITDVALERKIAFGHILPTYALEYFNSEIAQMIVEKTPKAELVYFHRKQLKGGQYSRLKEMFTGKGLKPVRGSDLELLS